MKDIVIVFRPIKTKEGETREKFEERIVSQLPPKVGKKISLVNIKPHSETTEIQFKYEEAENQPQKNSKSSPKNDGGF